MDNTAWKVSAAKLDGVLFRTEQHEIKKKCKTTHRYLVGKVRVTIAGQRKPTTVKCYGIVKQFYVHFMYKPKRSTYKLTAAKLATFEEPWILCALCEWFEGVGTNPVNGLPQIQPNSHWQAGCPMTNLATCIATNVTFWPSNPFDASHFDEDGQILDKDCPAYDFSGDSVFDVITMHEDIKL